MRLTHNARSARLGLEALENRSLLTAGITFNAADGIVNITGSPGHDVAQVRIDTQGTPQYDDDLVVVSLTAQGQTFTESFTPATVGRLDFAGDDGDDFYRNDTYITTWANGEAGNDTLWGGSADDLLVGGNGHDKLYGMAGNDLMFGDDPFAEEPWLGFGHDQLYGYTGDDTLVGGYGADWLSGEAGNDVLYSAEHDGFWDRLTGGTGSDIFVHEVGRDSIEDWWRIYFDGDWYIPV